MTLPIEKQFDFRATVTANVIIQVVLIYLFCFQFKSDMLQWVALLAVALYWILVALAYPRREQLSLAERVALRLGLGASLPLAALILYVIKQFMQ